MPQNEADRTAAGYRLIPVLPGGWTAFSFCLLRGISCTPSRSLTSSSSINVGINPRMRAIDQIFAHISTLSERATFRPPLTTLPPNELLQITNVLFRDCPRCGMSGKLGDVCFSLLQKNRKRHNGSPLSTGASLYARSWAEMA